jgi:hypothetical protein
MAHTIGNLALLGMLIIVTASFSLVVSSLQVEVAKEQLSSIGEYIALHLVEMATLVDTSNLNYSAWTGQPIVMVRNITLPSDIQGNIYLIQIVRSSPSDQYYLRLFILKRPDISVNISIPFCQKSSNIEISIKVFPSLDINSWRPQDRLYSGNEIEFASTSGLVKKRIQFCVWGYRNETLYVGLARWEDKV